MCVSILRSIKQTSPPAAQGNARVEHNRRERDGPSLNNRLVELRKHGAGGLPLDCHRTAYHGSVLVGHEIHVIISYMAAHRRPERRIHSLHAPCLGGAAS